MEEHRAEFQAETARARRAGREDENEAKTEPERRQARQNEDEDGDEDLADPEDDRPNYDDLF